MVLNDEKYLSKQQLGFVDLESEQGWQCWGGVEAAGQELGQGRFTKRAGGSPSG